MNINGKIVGINRLASGYVPFSGGVYHKSDERRMEDGIKVVRDYKDYQNFVKNVIPGVIQEREARGRRVIKDSSRWNLIKSKVGLYTLADFQQDRPIILE